MYICHCRAVTDRTIRAAIGSGATTVSEVARRCGAGARCGGCWPALATLLAETVDEQRRPASPAA
ncbi:MAG TPA: (2Fe-2S)-binding protein [Acidimicrobiales bacterium]|nr:(2Fe-2S)-binding protein [Acidimicrobiales bacterium]